MRLKVYFVLTALLFSTAICSAQTESKTREIKVTAFKYGYNPGIIILKKGETVKLVATSKDVEHGFAIKEYGINEVLKKGEDKEIKFVADKAGEFEIVCSVYCGPGHERMKGRLIVKE
jgi:cytochrome c oxidase subunit II